MAWTGDGSTVVGADFLGGLDVWNIQSGQVDRPFSGGLNVEITPDDGTVLSEGVAWDLAGSRRLGRSFRWKPSDGCGFTPCFWVDPSGRLMAETLDGGRVGWPTSRPAASSRRSQHATGRRRMR